MMEAKGDFKPHDKCNDCDYTLANHTLLVSVSPSRFSMPRSSEKPSEIEINNRNPVPIYFRATTTNMQAFRVHPNAGNIPPHSKVSAIVRFYNSVRPLRLHEEVVVWVSRRPFEMSLSDNACTYWYGAADSHDHMHNQKAVYQPEQFCDREGYRYLNEKGPSQYSAFHQSNGYQKSNVTRDGQKDSLTACRECGYAIHQQRHFEPPSVRVRPIIDNTIDERPKFGEICLHALVHRTASGQYECNNCVGISSDKKHDARSKEAEYTTFINGRQSSDPKPSLPKHEKLDDNRVAKKTEARAQRQTLKERSESQKVDTKDKSKGAHVLARIVRTKDSTGTSDSERSEQSSRDTKMRKRSKFISEEAFKKKVAKKNRKKYQKRLEEDSKRTTTSATTEVVTPKKETEKVVQKKSLAEAAAIIKKDSRCTVITLKCPRERVTCINLGLLLLLLLIVVAFFTFIFFVIGNSDHQAPCFFDVFKFFSKK